MPGPPPVLLAAPHLVPNARRLYAAALVAALGGLFFLFVGDPWMGGTSLFLSVGCALLAWGRERRAAPLQWGGYTCIGVALALLIIDTLQTYVF